ncbi:MAG: RDD family protein, partial [Gemmatimonadota bacterium]|nr:RDD family protein [Gemmatimonadota bacterium]
PWRRAAAMLVDLVLVGLLANARGVFLALAAGAALFWLAVRRRRGAPDAPQAAAGPRGRRAGRLALGCLGAVVVIVVLLVVVGPRLVPEDAVVVRAERPGGGSVPISVGAIGDLVALSRAADEDSVAARRAAERLVERFRAEGLTPEEMRDVLAEIRDPASGATIDAPVEALLREAVDAADATGGNGPGAPGVDGTGSAADTTLDGLLAALSAARAAGDSLEAARLRELLVPRLAEPELAARERANRELRAERDASRRRLAEARDELEAEREKGLLRTILNVADEFGLGLGWSGLYFTFLTGAFRGRTPGKRLLRVRVVRLDGRPLGFWASFERFGGYAASLFTGFEGFLRILWDANRQGIQDKIAETVVVADTSEVRARLAEIRMWGPDGRPGQARAGPRTEPRPPSTPST